MTKPPRQRAPRQRNRPRTGPQHTPPGGSPRHGDQGQRDRPRTGAKEALPRIPSQGTPARADQPRSDDRRAGPNAGPRRPPPSATKGLWLYGRHAVEAALANPRRSCHRLLATAEALDRLGARAQRTGVEVAVVERPAIDRLVGAGAVHQGLALSVAPLPRLDLRQTCAPEPGRNLVLALDQINDPHNLGAILRSAAAFAVRAVVMPERRSAEQGGAVAKAASGALDTVPVVEVVNLARALDELAALGYWRVALDASAEATVDAVPEIDDLVLVLGAEGTGVRRLVTEHCDLAARLPIAPVMDSLNVSVAAGIALYALARRGGS
jgi:23S rRNA (guanosine2251-2'-O)-methyltransferase